jgi:hypothetical protein
MKALQNKILAFFVFIFMSLPAGAVTGWTGFRSISDFGCHNTDGTCYLTIDGDEVSGGSNCTSRSIRWDSRNDPNGKTWLALLLTAKSLGTKVGFYVGSCYAMQPVYPTFYWGALE